MQRHSDDDELPAPRKKTKSKEASLVTDKELLARFYGHDSSLNAEDKFLRNYILNEGWKEAGGSKLTKDKEIMKLVRSEASGAAALFEQGDITRVD